MIEIDEEFQNLIPPLTDDEFKLLEEQCIRQGIRVPLTVWNTDGKTILIDGHNRYQIAQSHNLSFETEEERLESRDDAMLWIIDNQIGRRNLNTYNRALLENRRQGILAEQARKKMESGKADPPKKSWEGTERQRHRENETDYKIAKAAGISEDTVRKVRKIEAEATPQVKEAVRQGKLSINQAYNSTFPKVLNPVKEATKEHEEYQEKLKSGVVDINEAKKDKNNQDILYNGFMVELYKALRAVTGFGIMYTYKDIDKHTKKIPQQESEDLILKLDAVIGVLDYVRTEIERSNNERN